MESEFLYILSRGCLSAWLNHRSQSRLRSSSFQSSIIFHQFVSFAFLAYRSRHQFLFNLHLVYEPQKPSFSIQVLLLERMDRVNKGGRIVLDGLTGKCGGFRQPPRTENAPILQQLSGPRISSSRMDIQSCYDINYS